MLSLRVAIRYLFSKKSHNAVNLLSLVSVIGVTIATTAMVIVLSVFNGFNDLAAGKLSQMDPDLLVTPKSGKIIDNADSLAALINEVPEVSLASVIIKEQALAVTPEIQTPITIQGMTAAGVEATNLAGIIIDGIPLVGTIDEPELTVDGMNACVMSVGAAVQTGLRSGTDNVLQVYVPHRVGRINTASPMNAFRSDSLVVAGVYRVEQAEYDTDMVLVPLAVARRLLNYNDGQGSALQVYVTPQADPQRVADLILHQLGSDYNVLNRMQQQQQAFNMIAIEKWITLLMLAFILVITSFNIISAIYILKVEKKDNMASLRAMGATSGMMQNIFAWQGILITMSGGLLGVILGSAITLAQQFGHFIKLQANDTSMLSVEAYPVRLECSDLLIIGSIVLIVAIVCSRLSTLSKV